MKFEKTYSIKEGEWTKWNKTLASAIDDFCCTYLYNPNILEANDHTLSQFDFLVNFKPNERQRVFREDDFTGLKITPDETENIVLNSFSYCDIDCDIDIDFAVDNRLSNREFRLVYDDEPEWDEPETQDDCPVNEVEITYKKLQKI